MLLPPHQDEMRRVPGERLLLVHREVAASRAVTIDLV